MKVCFSKLFKNTFNDFFISNVKSLDNIFRDSCVKIIIFLCLLLVGGTELLHAQNSLDFSADKIEETLILNKPFAVNFTLSFPGDAKTYNINSLEFSPDENINIISSANKTAVTLTDEGIQTNIIFSYTLTSAKKDVTIPTAKLTLSDAEEKDVTLHSDEMYLTLKQDTDRFQKIKSAVTEYKGAITAFALAVFIGLLLVTVTIMNIKRK